MGAMVWNKESASFFTPILRGNIDFELTPPPRLEETQNFDPSDNYPIWEKPYFPIEAPQQEKGRIKKKNEKRAQERWGEDQMEEEDWIPLDFAHFHD